VPGDRGNGPLVANLETRDAELGAGACAERAYSDYRVVAKAFASRLPRRQAKAIAGWMRAFRA
jgi:hypothetical protein